MEASETGSRERNQKAVAKAQARQWKLLNHDKGMQGEEGNESQRYMLQGFVTGEIKGFRYVLMG